MGESKNLFVTVINYCHKIVGIQARYFFQIYYGRKSQQIPPIKDHILVDSVTTIAHKIRTKKITSVEVLNTFINRIREINPLLNCVVADRFEDALKEAQEADNLIKSDTMSEELLVKNKPFLGVPFTTKDAIAIKDMIQTAGLYKRRNFKATEDAGSIANLRNAGAIPIALTNVPELLMWYYYNKFFGFATKVQDGIVIWACSPITKHQLYHCGRLRKQTTLKMWESSNIIHGRTSNPYDTNRISGGSSGGEGCIQAAAGSAFGVGSDIAGSIRMPSFLNGIFGHKPSKSIVSNTGQYPVTTSETQNNMLCVGPMCRHAEDLLPILKVMVKDEVRNKLKLDEKVDIKNIKFYYQQSNMGEPFVTELELEITELFQKIAFHLNTTLQIKAEEVKIEEFSKSGSIWLTDMTNIKSGPTFGELLCDLEGSVNLSRELVKWCFGMSKHTFVALFFALMEKLSPNPSTLKSNHSVDDKQFLVDKMTKLLGNDGVFIYPTHPTAAVYHNEALFKPFNFTYTGIINSLGFPSTHCPMGLNSEGLPIGLQIISNIDNDRLCLAVAMELEKAFGGWVPPQVIS